MRTALRIINEAMAAHRKACLAFSGGSDSVLLMDLIFRHTEHRPVVVFAVLLVLLLSRYGVRARSF